MSDGWLNRRIVAAACALATFAIAGIGTASTSAAQGCRLDDCVLDVSAGGGGLNVTGQVKTNGAPGGPIEGGADHLVGAVAQYEHAYAPACPTNTPADAATLCGAATTTCPPGAIRFFEWQRLIDPAGGINPWLRIPGSQCLANLPTTAPVATPLIEAAVQQEFKNLPLDASIAKVQPAAGTLVNLDTIFYADTVARVFPLTILGTGVRVTATPQRWIWQFGDGAQLTTTTPGAPYPAKDVTHKYVAMGTVQPSVSVVWGGTFTIDGRPGTFTVNGTVQRNGPPIDLPVREARSELVNGG